MNEPQNKLATVSPFQMQSYEEMTRAAKDVAASGLFGITKPEQVMTLFMLCASEGLNPINALRRFWIIENKISMRADAMAGLFEASGGAILWHTRTDTEAAATFFADKRSVNDKAIERSKSRYVALRDGDYVTASEHAYPGEETIIRTIADADAKKVSMAWNKDKGEWQRKHNWKQSPRQMLTARAITEGVRLMNPAIIAGIAAPEEIEDANAAWIADAEGGDVGAMRALLAQHMANAASATSPQQRQRFLGLASDIRTQLAEMGESEPPQEPDTNTLPDATPVEQVPLPNTEPPTTTDENPEVIPPSKKEKAFNWRTIKCHIGTAQGPVLGKTLTELFETNSTKKGIALQKWFTEGFIAEMDKKQAAHIDLTDKESMLYRGLMEAFDALDKRVDAEKGGAQ